MYYFATAEEMEQLDNLAVQNGLEIMQMMELAGLWMVRMFSILNIPYSARVVVVCGKGNNGGDGLSATRFLVNYGWNARVILAQTALNNNASRHLRLLENMNVPIVYFGKDAILSNELIARADVIIDALFGYHIRGNPEKPYDDIITRINNSDATVIAYDLPSGLDGSSGHCFKPCVQAQYTLTLALPKRAFTTDEGKRQSGRIYLGDIGIPAFLYEKIHQNSHPMFNDGLIEL